MSRLPFAIYYEHPDWFRPVFAEIERLGRQRGLDVTAAPAGDGGGQEDGRVGRARDGAGTPVGLRQRQVDAGCGEGR